MSGQPGSGPPLYWRVLGADFAHLPAPVKALHDNPGRVVASGRCRVERGDNPLARLLAAFFGFPPAGDDVPLRVEIIAEGAGERWERDFAGCRLASLQGEVPGRPGWLYERFGPGHFTIDPRPSERGLSFALTGARIFGLPLPRWLWPAVVGDATAAAATYRFEVSIALPLVGLLVRYHGDLVPEEGWIDMLKGSCHCGAVTFELARPPEWRSECNCSICRRLGTLWGYFREEEVRFAGHPGATEAYAWGDRTLAFHRCRTCGCTTHWQRHVSRPENRMGVNTRLLEPRDVAGIPLRHYDGADSFKYLD